ncbi:MAG: glycosyltransferase [Candidatus Methylacidiphilales bacterium]|nr:glycosyltransferase [Candidatus Methylacidiphilales bacterium]
MLKVVSIGILAWNEEASIGATLDSLFGQSLFDEIGRQVQVVCVPNACTDDTVGAISRAYERAALRLPSVRMEIQSLERPGKANAWNEYVHRFADPAAEVMILADADILFHGRDTLRNMVDLLETEPSVVVATDQPIKHVALKTHKSCFDRISLAISRMTGEAPGQLTGQLYAARASFLRRLVIPEGILVEDGFLKQMVVTDCFTQPADASRIRRAPGAAHVFESYTRIGDILPNQRRQAVGHTIYTYLRDELQRRRGEGSGDAVIRRLSAEDPGWFLNVIDRRVSSDNWWVMHEGCLTARLRRWARGGRRWALLPAALVGTAMDLVVHLWANDTLKNKRLKGIWKDTKSQSLVPAALGHQEISGKSR